ncbi:hypothetical protein RJ640_009784 [Escallonia rubra]|uniref:SKP1 component POZ domain-containing protein n=1 Tax=Escallonia rubra TaxID=112253 RepID=A0AA88UNW7_9ASTE|nr:hypothetical protein RJ640_009784 [Escallonia rubra]
MEKNQTPYGFHKVIFVLLILLFVSMSASGRDILVTQNSLKPKNITLKSSDGESFDIEQAVALQSDIIQHKIESHVASGGSFNSVTVEVPNLTGEILAKVIEYCTKHAESSEKTGELSEKWDGEFIGGVEVGMLMDLFLAGYELKIKGLNDLAANRIGGMMIGKTPEEIRVIFDIKEDPLCKKSKSPKEGESSIRLRWSRWTMSLHGDVQL